MRRTSIRKFIKKFEKDITCDRYGFVVRFEKSVAQKELSRRGKSALKRIVRHLRQKPPSDFMNLDIAWGWLLGSIEKKVDPERTGPDSYIDTKGWVKWAKRIVQSR